MLVFEIIILYQGLVPTIGFDTFHVGQIDFYLRHLSDFFKSNVKTFYHDSERLSGLRRRTWSLVPSKLKKLGDMNYFVTEIEIKNGQLKKYLYILSTRFYRRRNKKKVDSIKTGRTVYC